MRCYGSLLSEDAAPQIRPHCGTSAAQVRHKCVPPDGFREHANEEDWPKAFVTPDAPTLRGLMDLKHDAALGIDPGLEFAWRRDRVKPLPAGNRTE